MTNERRGTDPATTDPAPSGEAPSGDAPGSGASRDARATPRRRPDLDWEREPTHGLDPEDSLRGGGDDLARLLADLPPHHVDR